MYELRCRVILRDVKIVKSNKTKVAQLCLHIRYRFIGNVTHPISNNVYQLRSIELYIETNVRM